MHPAVWTGLFADPELYPYYNAVLYTREMVTLSNRYFMDFNNWNKTTFIYDKASVQMTGAYQSSYNEYIRIGIEVFGTMD